MKQLVVFFSLIFAFPIYGQISLERTYYNQGRDFGIVNVDSAVLKFVDYNRKDSIFIYSLSHTLERVILVPDIDSKSRYELQHISKRLFDLNDEYEYLLMRISSPFPYLRAYTENGILLFSRDSCELHYKQNDLSGDANTSPSIVSTTSGVKMLVEVYKADNNTVEVYSLPGKLYECNTKLSVTDAPTIISSSSPSPSAYPNPSNGKIRVAYTLPEGVTTGELVITTADGREVKRYRVGNMFNDILIEKSELASGAYFYRLNTERGESEARKFVITN